MSRSESVTSIATLPDEVATDLKQRDEELAQQVLDEMLPPGLNAWHRQKPQPTDAGSRG